MLAPYAIPRYQELAKFDGVEVHVIVEKNTSADRLGWKFDEIEGVKTYLINKNYRHKFTKSNSKGNYSQSEEHIFSFGLRKIIKNINPEIVLVHNSCQLLMLIGPRKYKLGVLVEDTLRANEGRKKINRFVKRILLKTADFYCAFSDDSVEFLKSYGIKNNIIRTSWSIDNKTFTNLTEDDKVFFADEYGISKDKTNFLIVANLLKLKGIVEFLHSWKKASLNLKNKIFLYVAGEGPLRNEIDQLINDKEIFDVKLLGHVDYSVVKKFLQVVDVFTLPTLEDLNPLVVYEALAARKPLLISKYAGNRFLVSEGVNGYIFNPYNEQDSMDKIIKMFNSDLALMAKESQSISEQYTNKIVMKKFYDDLCKLYA